MRPRDRQAAYGLRLGGALALATAFVAGGLALERAIGVRPIAGPPPIERVTGSWYCPHGGGEGWEAWVVVANSGTTQAQVQAVTYGPRAPARTGQTVEPGALAYLEVPAPSMAAGTQVEFFGGPVAAGMVLSRPKGGLGADACSPEAGQGWHLPDGTTQRGRQQNLVIVNPFDQEAVLDVTLAAGDETIRHGSLTGVVIPPRRSAAFDLNRFALGKRTLAASIAVQLGRVAASSVGLVEGGGLRLTLGSRGPATSWVLPGAGEDGPTELLVLGAAERPAPFRARSQGGGRQQEVLGDGNVEPGTAITYTLPAQDAGLVVEGEGPRPFVVARRLLQSGVADQASTPGVAPATSVVVTPVVTPDGGPSTLIVQNPADEVAEVRIGFLTGTGPAEAPSLSSLAIGPGRTRLIPLDDLVGQEPVAIRVEALQGRIVAAQVTTGSRFALAPGSSMSLFER